MRLNWYSLKLVIKFIKTEKIRIWSITSSMNLKYHLTESCPKSQLSWLSRTLKYLMKTRSRSNRIKLTLINVNKDTINTFKQNNKMPLHLSVLSVHTFMVSSKICSNFTNVLDAKYQFVVIAYWNRIHILRNHSSRGVLRDLFKRKLIIWDSKWR